MRDCTTAMKNTRRYGVLGSAIFILLIVGACSDGPDSSQTEAAASFQKELQLRFINAKAGDVITIPAGVDEINRSLSLNVSGVTIRGEGMDKTVLSFKNQVRGAKGLLVNASDFTIEDLAIEDKVGTH